MVYEFHDATIFSIETHATVSGSDGGTRDKDGNVHYYVNAPVSIEFWFDNEGVSRNDWNTHFKTSLWVDGTRVATKSMLSDTGRMSGNRSFTFYNHKFNEPGVHTVELRGKNTMSTTVSIIEKK